MKTENKTLWGKEDTETRVFWDGEKCWVFTNIGPVQASNITTYEDAEKVAQGYNLEIIDGGEWGGG